MPRSKKNPDFDRDKLEEEILKTVVELYNCEENRNHDVSYVAEELGMSALKARKLLITAGERFGKVYYSTALSAAIQSLKAEGKSNAEIASLVGLSHASVIGYLPYSKTVYGMREVSADAERVKRFRDRQVLCATYMDAIAGMPKSEEEEYLWSVLIRLSGCVFHTAGRGQKSGVKFRFNIKGGEMKVDRKEKTITKATVLYAYGKAKSMGIVKGPKALGVPGAHSYLLPIFLRLCVCRT